MKLMRSPLFWLPVLLSATLLPAQTPALKKTAASTMPAKNFKESGSPSAPIQIEVYTDYECPACRALYMDVLPQLNRDYVQTGKVRLLHRDFPLPQHKYSPLATKYANAAGQIGKYDIVAAQIFKMQPQWEQNGNVDAEVAKVLSPADLQSVRDIVKAGGPDFDSSVKADIAMGDKDALRETPTIVIVARGKREVISGAPPYSILKSYLDKKLAQ